MAITPNFSWQTPSPTDYVTDLPADFETFADAVDASVWTIKGTADAALPETIIDAAGDLIYGTAADTAGRLAIGTAGQILQVNAGATAPEWVTPAAAGGGMEGLTLLNSGNTTVGTGSLKTWSSLPSYQNYVVYINNVKSSNNFCYFWIEAGGSPTAISWTWAGMSMYNQASYNKNNFNVQSGGGADLSIGSHDVSDQGMTGFVRFFNANKTGLKWAEVNCGNATNTEGGRVRSTRAFESGSSGVAIDYIKIGMSSGTFVGGNVTIWGA